VPTPDLCKQESTRRECFCFNNPDARVC
jgi:hypothetical protein